MDISPIGSVSLENSDSDTREMGRPNVTRSWKSKEGVEGPGRKAVPRLRVQVMGVGWGWCAFFYVLCQRALGEQGTLRLWCWL